MNKYTYIITEGTICNIYNKELNDFCISFDNIKELIYSVKEHFELKEKALIVEANREESRRNYFLIEDFDKDTIENICEKFNNFVAENPIIGKILIAK